MSADEDTWIETLAGRAAAESSAAREAALLRARILAEPAADVPLPAASDPAREEALIARARAEGLLPDRRRGVARGARFRGWRTGFAAAALVVLAIGVVLTSRSPAPDETVRGPSTGIVRIEAADPYGLQRELLAELTAAGVSVTAYDRLGAAGLDADLPVPLTESVRAVLKRHRIAIPADGVLVIEIREPAHP